MPSPHSDRSAKHDAVLAQPPGTGGRLVGWSLTCLDRDIGLFPTPEAARAAAQQDAGFPLAWTEQPSPHGGPDGLEGGDPLAIEHDRVYATAWNSIAGYREEAEAAAVLRATLGSDRAARRYRVEAAHGTEAEADRGAEYVAPGSGLYVVPAQDGWALRCEAAGEVLGQFASRADALAHGRAEHRRRERGTAGGARRLLALFTRRG